MQASRALIQHIAKPIKPSQWLRYSLLTQKPATLRLSPADSSLYLGIKPRIQTTLSIKQQRLAKQLLSDISRQISVADVAKECALSRSHFSREFKQCTGLAPRDWMRKVRVEKAKLTLLNSTLSICEIALEHAFSDQSHFSRVFRRETGSSPDDWRKKQTG